MIYTILRVSIILILIRQLLSNQWENAFNCILALLLFLVPAFVERNFHIEIPTMMEMIIYIFIYAAEILGEVGNFYIHFSWWDTLLHTVNGFNCAAIGFSMLELLNRKGDRFNLSPLYLSLVSFCFSMTVGVIWEFFEFTIDHIALKDMQKDDVITEFASNYFTDDFSSSLAIRDIEYTEIHTEEGVYLVEGGYLDIGLTDTIEDLFVNFLGAITFSIAGYYYVKSRKNERLIEEMVPRYYHDSNDMDIQEE